MKKILVITHHTNPSPEVPLILNLIKEKTSVDQVFWNEILYYYDGHKKHTIYFDIAESHKLTKLSDYDAVYIRSDAPTDRDTLHILVRETEHLDIPLIGFHPHVEGTTLNAKADTTHYCSTELNMKFPEGYFGNYALLLKHFDTIAGKLGLPLVCKPNNLSKGRGVALIQSKKQLHAHMKEVIKTYGRKKFYFIMQKFVPNDGDYRILVIGNNLYGIKRRSNNKKEFRNNFSLGGSVQKIAISPDMKLTAKQIKKALKLDFAGIDFILRGKTKIFLEVNRTPGLSGVSQAHGTSMFDETRKYIEKKLYKKTG